MKLLLPKPLTGPYKYAAYYNGDTGIITFELITDKNNAIMYKKYYIGEL